MQRRVNTYGSVLSNIILSSAYRILWHQNIIRNSSFVWDPDFDPGLVMELIPPLVGHV